MKNFFQKVWVQVIAWVCVIIGTAVLILGGVDAGKVAQIPTLVFGIIEAIGVLILFIKSMLQAKDTKNK
jgi:hypothetical protein